MSEISNDYTFAQAVCKREEQSTQRFILDMSDHALWISKKWHNDFSNFEDSYSTKTLSGDVIDVNDDISDTWTWLLKKIVLATCKFEGINNAKLSTFIFGVLNSPFTFNDWLKSKYGDTAYIPNIIRKLPETHQKIYTLLKRKSNINKICSSLDIERSDAEYIVHEIKAILFSKGKGGMLGDTWIKIDNFRSNQDGENEDNYIDNIKDIANVELECITDIEQIYESLKKSFLNLSKTDQRLLKLYWTENLNVKQILLYIENEAPLTDFSNLNFSNEKEFYSYIQKLISQCSTDLKENDIVFYNQYDLDISKIKNSLKVMIGNFEI